MFGFGFLNSFFLVALGAMVLPIVIHILNRRRLRKIDFSSLEFIFEVSRRRMSKINLRRWLILALRTLAVMLIVMAFARPTLKTAAALFMGEAPKNVVICLDTSSSMGVELETGTALTAARELARTVIDEAGDNDIINVVAFSRRAEVLFSGGSRNKQVVKNAIAGLEVTAEGTSYEPAVTAAVEAAAGTGVQGAEIYVISDFREGPDSLAFGGVPGDVRVMIMPVYRAAVDNISIDRVFTPRKLIRPGEVVRIGVAVTNHSRTQPQEFPLELYVGETRRAEKVVNLAPATSVNVDFAVSLNRWGRHACRVAKPKDRLPVDDDRFFLLEVSREIPVTLIRGRKMSPDGEATPAYFYVEKALNPRGSAEGEFRVRPIGESELTRASLPGPGVVVWTDPTRLNSARLDVFKRYIEGGGAALIFLNDDRRGLWKDESFARYLGIQAATPKERKDGERWGTFQGDHPVFSLFNDEELQLLAATRIQRYLSVSGIAPDSVVAYFAGGDPAVWESRRGRGRLLVVAMAPDMAASDLPVSPMFLPFVHTSVSYLASAEASDTRSENLAGADLFFELPPDWTGDRQDLRVVDDGGVEWQPSMFETLDGGAAALVPRASRLGYYRLYADSALVAEAAVNVDTDESNLNPRPIDGDAVQARVIDTGADLAANLERARQGREVYTLFLYLAIAALVAESILGRKA